MLTDRTILGEEHTSHRRDIPGGVLNEHGLWNPDPRLAATTTYKDDAGSEDTRSRQRCSSYRRQPEHDPLGLGSRAFEM